MFAEADYARLLWKRLWRRKPREKEDQVSAAAS
jgi:hypothetical protein